MSYLIDVTGTCNLRCPSCPVGNFKEGDFIHEQRPKGFMDLNLFKEIILKIKADNTNMLPLVDLYNWGEALIHPNIIEMIEFINQQGLQTKLSNNFNTELDMKALVKTKPISIIISTSGYYQNTYELGHRGGKIALVKSNMYRLRYYMEKLKTNFSVRISYHIYRDNAHDDIVMMSRLCQELNFNLQPGWAFIQPLEKVLQYLQGRQLPEEDQAVLKRLVIDPRQRYAIASQYHLEDCSLRSHQMTINYDGSVALCCGTFDPKYNIASSFLEVAHAELQKRKYEHPFCGICMQHSLHKMSTLVNLPELHQLGNQVLEKLGSPMRLNYK